jgi:hypothetical protein
MPNRSQFVLQALAMPTRRFPLPCSVEEKPACFVVPDHNGQALACVYFEDAPGRRSTAELLSKDEADDCGVYLRETKGGIVMAKTLAIIAGAKKSIAAINMVLTIFRMCLCIAAPLYPGTYTPSPE